MLTPTFTLSIGSFSSTSDNPAGGPIRFVVDRDMDVPADSLQLALIDRFEIELDDDVQLALGHDGEEEQVFAGNVVRIEPGLAGVRIFALGSMNALLNLYAAVTYEDQSPGAIARDLIGQAGLSEGTIDDGPALPRFAIDHGLSAYAHLKGLANRLGYELYANRDGAVMFHALGDAAGLDAGSGLLGAAAGLASGLLGGGSEQYQFGQHLIGARSHRRPTAWERIQVGGESPMSGLGDRAAHWLTVEDEGFRGTAGSGDRTLSIFDPAARTKDLADRFAAGRKALADRVAHQVRFTVMGRPQVDLGDTLAVGEAPDGLLNGQGYVRAIRNRFGPDVGYITDFRISLSVTS